MMGYCGKFPACRATLQLLWCAWGWKGSEQSRAAGVSVSVCACVLGILCCHHKELCFSSFSLNCLCFHLFAGLVNNQSHFSHLTSVSLLSASFALLHVAVDGTTPAVCWLTNAFCMCCSHFHFFPEPFVVATLAAPLHIDWTVLALSIDCHRQCSSLTITALVSFSLITIPVNTDVHPVSPALIFLHHLHLCFILILVNQPHKIISFLFCYCLWGTFLLITGMANLRNSAFRNHDSASLFSEIRLLT